MFSFNTLSQFFRKYPASSYLIAYSGGLDSHVLLYACALLRRQQPGLNFRAIHIDHGLQAESAGWVGHCRQVCSDLAVPLRVESLNLIIPKGSSLEAVARNARLQAFADQLNEDEIILTAHHQGDQAETLLLNLLRGAGVDGLAAMPESRVFHNSLICRPLLNIPRRQLEQYAAEQHLQWIEDPSNQSLAFDRNYLRHEVMPRLQERWPAASSVLTRAAQWQSESAEVQAYFLDKELPGLRGSQPDTLSVVKLLEQPESVLKALLRHWLKQRQFVMPGARKLAHVLNDVLLAKEDAKPCVSWQGCEVHRYQGNLYAIRPQSVPDAQQIIEWPDPGQPLWVDALEIYLDRELFAGLYPVLSEQKAKITVRFRRGGEKLITKQGYHHSLKKWFQEQGIPPWQRSRTPLVYANDQIVAIPGFYRLDVCQYARKAHQGF